MRITWMPCPSFTETATVLLADDVAAMAANSYSILQVLTGEVRTGTHRPAVVMWQGSALYLAQYAVTMCRELRIRGAAPSDQESQIRAIVRDAVHNQRFDNENNRPYWLSHSGLMISHQSALRSHNPYYRTVWSHVADDLPMVYPRATAQKVGT